MKRSIREVRLSLGLTQAELAQLLGVAHSTVCCWEVRDHEATGVGKVVISNLRRTPADELVALRRVLWPALREGRPLRALAALLWRLDQLDHDETHEAHEPRASCRAPTPAPTATEA